jgi:hypothetical protein
MINNDKNNLTLQEKEEALNSIKARQIVQEIIKFGMISDKQILKIIKFLSLELENINLMKQICDLIESNSNELNTNKKIKIEL